MSVVPFHAMPVLTSDEAELNVVGASMLDPSRIRALLDLRADHFFDAGRGRLWAVLQAMDAAGTPIDPVTVSKGYTDAYGSSWSTTGTSLYGELAEITNETLSAMNVAAYAQIVIDCAARRAAVEIGKRLVQTCDVPGAIQALMDAERSSSTSRWSHTAADFNTELVALEQGPQPGIPSGWTHWDDRCGGLHRGDLIVAASRPKVGKTALAANMAINAKVPVLFFSGEQSFRQLLHRAWAAHARVPLERMRVSGLHDADWPRLISANEDLRQRLHIVDLPSPSLADIQRHTRRAVYEHGVQLVIVDYIQRMSYDPKTARHEGVGGNVRGLKELARVHDIPVLALSQVKREVDSRPLEKQVPNLSDLSDSGEIEKEADVVWTMFRRKQTEPESTDNTALLSCRANRSGPQIDWTLVYHEQILRFENWKGMYA